MKRWILRLLSTLFVLLFLATGALWVRSYWVGEIVQQQSSHLDGLTLTRDTRTLVSSFGGLYVNLTHRTWTAPDQQQADKRFVAIKEAKWQLSRLNDVSYAGASFQQTQIPTHFGFGINATAGVVDENADKSNSVVFPYALPAVLVGLIAWMLLNRTASANLAHGRRFIASPEFADNSYLRPTTEFTGNR